MGSPPALATRQPYGPAGSGWPSWNPAADWNPIARTVLLRDRDVPRAREAAHAIGVVIAAELLACGVDLSFAPVLDLDALRTTRRARRATA